MRAPRCFCTVLCVDGARRVGVGSVASRIDTLLSRALLDAGKVDASVLEAAVQDQVAHGGCLDTLLLERGAIDEPSAAAFLARAWGTLPVAEHGYERPDVAAVRLIPERMAVTMQLCPFLIDDEGLHVVAPAPLDRALIGEVSMLLNRVLVPHVVPEMRVWQTLANAYGVVPHERFVSLLHNTAETVVAHAQVRALDEEEDFGDEPAPAHWSLADAFAHLVAQESKEGIHRVAVRFARKYLPFAALLGARFHTQSDHEARVSATGWLRSGPAEGVQFLNQTCAVASDCLLSRVLLGPAPFVGRPEASVGNAALFGWLGRTRPRTVLAVPIVVRTRVVGALIADGGIRTREVHALTDVVSFAARLGPAFEALLRQRSRAVSLLGASASPHRLDVPAPPPLPAHTNPHAPRPITINAMPAVVLDAKAASSPARDGSSPFARTYSASPPPSVVAKNAPLPPTARAPEIAAPGALQTFAGLSDSTASLAWQGALSDAIAQGHQGGTATDTTNAGRAFVDDDDASWEDIVVDAAHAFDLARGRRAAAVLAAPSLVEVFATAVPPDAVVTPSVALDVPSPAPPPRSSAELVDALAAVDETVVAKARVELLARGTSAIDALARAFPGRMTRDPFDSETPLTSPHALGPLLGVLAELGSPGLDVACAHLDSRFPAHRLAAALLFAYTPDVRAIDVVRARLHDQEPRIQLLAAQALAPFVAHARFAAVLSHLRERLAAPSVPARRRAVVLLGTFRDVSAVPLLIALLDRHAEHSEDVRQSLRAITLADFGIKARAWEKWWGRAKKQSRVDWLLDGLLSDDRELRVISHQELTALAGDAHGYHADLPRADRKRSADGFVRWWKSSQTPAAPTTSRIAGAP